MRAIALVALGLLALPTSCSSEGTAPARRVRALLAGGADPHVADRDGTTPVAHARERGQPAIVALLTNR